MEVFEGQFEPSPVVFGSIPGFMLTGYSTKNKSQFLLLLFKITVLLIKLLILYKVSEHKFMLICVSKLYHIFPIAFILNE